MISAVRQYDSILATHIKCSMQQSVPFNYWEHMLLHYLPSANSVAASNEFVGQVLADSDNRF